MILHSDAYFSPSIPSGASFFSTKTIEELRDSEGLGFFHDTWSMGENSFADAGELVAREARFISIVDGASATLETFESVATALEQCDPSYLPTSVPAPILAELKAVIKEFDDMEPALDELELGVAGLTYALNAAGFVTAASCRSHAHDHSWAPAPVVLFAADRRRADRLLPLVSRAKCGLAIDENRPEFLAVAGPSIRNTARLAQLILANQ